MRELDMHVNLSWQYEQVALNDWVVNLTKLNIHGTTKKLDSYYDTGAIILVNRVLDYVYNIVQ